MSSVVMPDLVGAELALNASKEVSTSLVSHAPHDESSSTPAVAPTDVSEAGTIDLEQVEDLRGIFGADAFAQLFVKFETDLRRRLEIIDTHKRRADVASNAHAMVSSAGSLGFTVFSDLCRAIEQVAQSDSDMEPSIVALKTGSEHVFKTIASLAGSTEV